MNCSNCGAEMRPQNQFCPVCGMAYAAAPQADISLQATLQPQRRTSRSAVVWMLVCIVLGVARQVAQFLYMRAAAPLTLFGSYAPGLLSFLFSALILLLVYTGPLGGKRARIAACLLVGESAFLTFTSLFGLVRLSPYMSGSQWNPMIWYLVTTQVVSLAITMVEALAIVYAEQYRHKAARILSIAYLVMIALYPPFIIIFQNILFATDWVASITSVTQSLLVGVAGAYLVVAPQALAMLCNARARRRESGDI